MKAGTSRGLAIGLVVFVLLAGGVVGYVFGQRSAVTSSAAKAPAAQKAQKRLKRFTKRLGLSEEQQVAVSAVLKETRESVVAARAAGQEKILALLDDEQKVRYQKMLERQKERRAKRREARKGKKGKKRKRDNKRERDEP